MAIIVDHGNWLYVMAMTAEECNKLQPYWEASEKMKIGSGLRIDKPVTEASPGLKYMENSEIVRKLDLTVGHA